MINTLGLLPLDPVGRTERFRYLSWRTALSFIFWSVLPSIYLAYQHWSMIPFDLVNHGIKKTDILILCFAALNMTTLMALPFLRVNLMVKGKISLDATWRSVNLMMAPAILTYFCGAVWNSVNVYLVGKGTSYDLALSVPTYLIILTQKGTGLLIFDIAVNWVLEENEAIDEATSSENLLSAFTRLINKYMHLKNGSRGILFFMCFNYGLVLFGTAWMAYFVSKYSLLYAMPLVLITLAHILLLKVLTSLADDAYERLFIHQYKLR